MFHPALWKLIRLQWYGHWRQFCRSLKTTRGIIFAAFVFAMILYGMGSLYFASMVTSQSPQFTNATGKLMDELFPVGFFLAIVYVILFSTGEATVHFTASEAAFLFPAPISRKQLLSYTLLKSLLGMAVISLFFMCFTSPGIVMAGPRWLAVLLTLGFLQLLTMNVAFVRQVLEEKMHVTIRRILSLVIGGTLLLAVLQTAQVAGGKDFVAIWKAFQESTITRWLLAPCQIFVRALRAKDLMEFAPYALVLWIVDLLLLQVAYRMDALSLESALAISEKMAARLKLMQAKGVAHAFAPATSAVAQRRIPQLPFWGGIGPVLWQRLTTTFRASSKLLWVAVGLMAFGAGLVYLISRTNKFAGPSVGIGAMGYLSFLLCMMLQNDIDRVGFLKSLPIRTFAIVVGDWIGFPLLLSLMQLVFIVSMAFFFPAASPWLLAGACLTLPLNLLLFGIDKLVFYIYPTRMAGGAPGDFQNAAKQMMFVALKMLILGAAALIVVVASLPGALILQSPIVAVASAGFVLALECAVLIPLLMLAFDRFDHSMVIAA